MDLNMTAFARFARTFKAGEIIFSEYEPGDTFYLIQSGRVKLIKDNPEFGRTLDILQPTEMFGEMAILEDSPRSATAIAMDDVNVIELNAQNFEPLILGNPQIALKLLRIFSRRIYEAKRRFMILTLTDPEAKVADVFLMLDETQPNIDKSDDHREFDTNVDNIAQWAGMNVNQTKDILTRFTNQRRIDIYPDRIVVKNINEFTRFVNSRRNNR
jgi:CRP-like cAMP-binding protein